MKKSTLELLVWLLIYGGLLVLCLGAWVQRLHETLGLSLVLVGAAASALGAGLIYVRSRMKGD